MAFYENTLIAKQDLAEKDLKDIKNKYNDLINSSSGKVLKIEEWGLLNLASKIRNYTKGFYIHYKFEGDKNTLAEFNKKINIDSTIIRHLLVKYKKLNLEKEYFSRREKNNEKKK